VLTTAARFTAGEIDYIGQPEGFEYQTVP